MCNLVMFVRAIVGMYNTTALRVNVTLNLGLEHDMVYMLLYNHVKATWDNHTSGMRPVMS